jgi:hypothetical protein
VRTSLTRADISTLNATAMIARSGATPNTVTAAIQFGKYRYPRVAWVAASQRAISKTMPAHITMSGGMRAARALPRRISPSLAGVASSGSRLRSTFSPTML